MVACSHKDSYTCDIYLDILLRDLYHLRKELNNIFRRKLMFLHFFKTFGLALCLSVSALPAFCDDSDSTSTAPLSRSEIVAQIDTILNHPDFRNCRWGVMITDANSTTPLYDRDGDKSFIPASNLKMYTTAAAIDLLGADWRWKTNFYANGKVRKGFLNGDLVVVGSGDPTLSGRYFDCGTTEVLRGLAQKLDKAGVHRISGNVIIDDSYMTQEDYCDSWPWADIPEWYSTESGAAAINDNCWDAFIVPAKKVGQFAKIQRVFPTTDFVTFVSEVMTTVPQAQGGSSSIRIYRPMDSNVITLSGTLPVDAKPYKEWGSVRYGERMFAAELRAALRKAGIRVSGKPLTLAQLSENKKQQVAKRDSMTLLYTHESLPLKKVIALINKPSQNFYADMLCRTLDRECGGRGGWDGCDRVVRHWFTDTVGVQPFGMALADGSGLSRRNMVTPQLTVALLRRMNNGAAPEACSAFYDSLPIAGVDGTISGRMRNTPAAGNCHAKTGFIGHMRSLSGYVDDKSGRRWLFSMMANNYISPTSQVNGAQDKIVALLAGLEGELTE